MSNNNFLPKKTVFSLGFRCSSASLIKSLGLKNESYPFDWLVSRLSVIRHCIETDFVEFLNLDNYKFKITNTYEMASSNSQLICDEHIMLNTFYQPPGELLYDNTYQAYLATNHHNITEPETYAYYERCIHRFKQLLKSDEPKLYVHITPLIRMSDYENNELSIFDECMNFHTFMRTQKTNIDGLFFIMVRDDESPLFKFELLCDNYIDKTKPIIYLIKANQCFLDAGECFMGGYNREIEFMKGVINEHAVDHAVEHLDRAK